MKRIVKKAVYGVQTGVVLGLVISLIFNYLAGAKRYYPSSPQFSTRFATSLDAVLVSVILWAVMGLVFSLGAVIFGVEDWSLFKRTVVNFFIYYLGFTPLAILAGWFPVTPAYLISFTVIFMIIYVLMWVINVAIVRHQIDKINRRLKRG
ncbi:DUF3021 domain-containing protein [Lactiplantibacillus plajomi]|uniref:DUF3021 domain-containing protein n=1 Tax=Lactiplantibacillus plajomi TaxID=1457217 RepID=A0ABV6K0G6_9LACO|nr:DUF3021 domain-containing protein [Lactiplantibacillus plajomi]